MQQLQGEVLTVRVRVALKTTDTHASIRVHVHGIEYLTTGSTASAKTYIASLLQV